MATLALDLGVLNRKAHVISIPEAMKWSAIWILMSLAFGAGVYYVRGWDDAFNYIAGYLIEKSLSVDNLFVLHLIFTYFAIPARYQHKVLFWGILGAVVMRFSFIMAGVAIIKMFHWTLYLFGAFLVFSGIKMATSKESDEIDFEKNLVLRAVRRIMPVTPEMDDGRFFISKDSVRHATPIFIAMVLIEFSDVIFAMDSIPAIFAVTLDPFIVYTSNIFAILGLRSLYFALAGMMTMFHYLRYGLAVILVFLGAKMLAAEFVHLPVLAALGIIALILVVSAAASIFFPPAKEDGKQA
ncbi:MAG: TerC family protein [Nitrospinae bacterium]|nr:TerC family protein [Nitrospinota bacterium]